ncbi:apm2 [Symbiodinium sp. CCMP2592]|nr:apm2 [Symbiodinium sp. CCMP2592]
MISSVLLVNLKGEILIWRAYKDNVTRADWTLFCGQVVAAKETRDKPVVSINGSHFLYITQGDIVLVACTKDNVNVMLVLKLLHKMVDLFKAYFGGAFDENQVRKNFVLIYELLLSRSCNPFGIDSGMSS